MVVWKRFVAALAAGVMLVAGLATGGPAWAEDEPDAPVGYFDWLIRPSFDSYVGGGTPSDGALKTEEGKYRFAYDSGAYEEETRVTDVQFTGTVHYEKYHGAYPDHPDVPMLDVTISDPRIVLSEEGSVLYADVQSREMNSDPTEPPTDYGTIVLANLNPTLGEIDVTDNSGDNTADDATSTAWSSISASLSEEGVPAFAGFYTVGASLDHVSFAHPGAGDRPTAEERFDSSGMPALAESGRWQTGAVDGPSAQGSSIFAADDGSVVFLMTRTGLARPDAAVYALDPATLDPLSDEPTIFPATNGVEVNAFDPATVTFYSGQAASSGDHAGSRIVSYTWNPDTLKFDEEVVLERDPGENSAGWHGMAWDPERDRLVAVSWWNRGSPHQIYVVEQTDAGWEPTLTELPHEETIRAPRWGNTEVPLLFRTEGGSSYQVLEDGSILVPGSSGENVVAGLPDGTSVRRELAPTLLAVGDDNQVQAEAVEDLVRVGADRAVDGVWVKDIAANRTYVDSEGRVVAYRSRRDQSSTTDDPEPWWRHHVSRHDRELVIGDPLTQPAGLVFESAVGDPTLGVDYLYDGWHGKVAVYRDGKIIGEVPVSDTFEQGGLNTLIDMTIAPDGSAIYLPIRDGSTRDYGLVRLEVQGIAPTVENQPQDTTVRVDSVEDTTPAAFDIAVDEGEIQWQAKAPGAASFTDVDGATTPHYETDVAAADHGTQYRAVISNDHGTVATKPAGLTVEWSPEVLTQPRDITLTAGADALFTTTTTANPPPEVTWQRRVDGFWQNIAEDDDNFTITSDEGASTLTVLDTNTAMSGSRFRAKARNDAGRTFTSAGELTVDPKTTIPDDGLAVDGVVLEWSGSEELQSAPPFGGSNYFSAGVSDGDQATYQPTEGDVEILHVAPNGDGSAASYASRDAQATGDVTQLVRLGGGTGEVEPDGSADIAWEGTWSVNFYGGLVPFWITDPELSVNGDGEGTLTADLDGYGSTQADPNQRHPLDAVEDVVIATFADVEVDPAGVVKVVPDYAGVEIDIPAEHTAQDTSAEGWGAWPQGFVDFHFDTGLSSYWYSSGGAADSKKPPASFVVDFTDADQATGPVPTRTEASLTSRRVRYGRKPRLEVEVTTTGGADQRDGDVVPQGRVTARVAGHTVAGRLGADGTAMIRLPGKLPVRRHRVTVSYPGNQHAQASTGVTRLRVPKAIPRVKIKARARKRLKVNAKIKIPGAARARYRGQVVLRDGGRIIKVKRIQPKHHGKVKFRLGKRATRRLGPGRHYLTVRARPTKATKKAISPIRKVRIRR